MKGFLARWRPKRVDRLMDEARALADGGDHEGALQIWGPLAQAGIARAQNNVGGCFAHGRGVQADAALALRWLTLAAENGDRVGQRNVATLYFEGLGVERDYEIALRWFRAAAEQDDGEAQDMLAWMLLDGEIVAQDFGEARRWAEAAALKGFAGAATRLGTLHFNALGGDRDLPAAVSWWRRASDGGDGDGTALLGAAYHLGQGVAPDQDEAFFLLTLATKRGSLLAARYLGSVQARLSAQAIRLGEQRAAGFIDAAERGSAAA